MSYEVTLKADVVKADVVKGNVVETVEGADAYVQEGPLTTFFQGRDGRTVLDAWARRLASFRTADIVCVRWAPPPADLSARADRLGDGLFRAGGGAKAEVGDLFEAALGVRPVR